MKNSKLLITIASACFIFTTISLILAKNTPSQGYELSIYESTSFLVWLFLILSILGGVFILIYQALSGEYKFNNFWTIGFFLLLLNRISILYLPYIRGYYSWRGDNISHFGYIFDIISIGGIPSHNFYPITHIFLSEIVLISNLTIQFVANHSTALITVLYILSIYLVSSAIFKDTKYNILSVAAICCVFFNDYEVFLRPNAWAFLLLPFVVVFAYKSSIEHKILLLVFLLLYPFLHPLASLLLIIILINIVFIDLLFAYVIKSDKLHSVNVYSVILEGIIFLMWILSFTVFHNNIRGVYRSLTTDIHSDVLSGMAARLDKIDVHGYEFIELILKLKGEEIIFILFGIIAIYFSLKAIYSHNLQAPQKQKKLIILEIIFSISGLLYIFYLTNIAPSLYYIGGERIQRFMLLFTPILFSFSAWEISKKILSRKIFASFLILIIMTSSIISIFALYKSPYTLKPNPSITQQDMDGMEWYIDYKNQSTHSMHIMSPPDRFGDAILGAKSANLRNDLKYSSNIPDHFNYTNNNIFGRSIPNNSYIILTKMDRIIYSTVWDVVGRFNYGDFDKLESDYSSLKLYDNGETLVFYANAIK